MKFLKWIILISLAFLCGALHLSSILQVTFNLGPAQLRGLSPSDTVEVLAYITEGFSKRQILYLFLQCATLSAVYLGLIFCLHQRRRRHTVKIATCLVLLYTYQTWKFQPSHSTSATQRDIPNFRSLGEIQTVGRPLSHRISSPKLPDIYFFLLESVRGDHFNETYYPRTLEALQRIPSWGTNEGKAIGTETAISVPRILHGISNPGSQHFSCETSLPANLHQLGYSNHFWSSQSYEWRKLKQLLSCGPHTFTGIKEVRDIAKKEPERFKLPLQEGLHRLPNAVDDSFISQLFSLHLLKERSQPEAHLVHFYNTHYPYLGNSHPHHAHSFISYSSLEGLFQASARGKKNSLAKQYRESYQAALIENDKLLASLILKILDRSQRNNRSAIVVITSDHGEEFGEHGEILHSSQTSPYETLTKVPIYFASTQKRFKSRFMNNQNTRWVGHLDIVATIYDLLDVGGEIVGEGQSVFDFTDRFQVSFSQSQKSAFFRHPFKVIADLPQRTLTGFDLVADPQEKSPLSADATRSLFNSMQEHFQPSIEFLMAKGTPLIIAHRGDHRFLAENSGAALLLAKQSGADGVEIDVRLTADGEAIVFHDEKYRAADGSEHFVRHAPLSQIRNSSTGLKAVLTLDQALSQIHQGLVIIEMKAEHGINPALLTLVGKAIVKHDLSRRALASSVNLNQARAFQNKFPQLYTLFELHGVSQRKAIEIAKQIPRDKERTFVSFSTKIYSPTLLSIVKERFAGSSVFTPNSDSNLGLFLERQVNLIQTDQPHRLWKIRSKNNL